MPDLGDLLVGRMFLQRSLGPLTKPHGIPSSKGAGRSGRGHSCRDAPPGRDHRAAGKDGLMVQTGQIASGFAVSSGFFLQSTERSLTVLVSSAAANQWFFSFAPSSTSTYVRLVDPQTAGTTTAFSGSSGGWMLADFVPSQFVRIEAGVTVTASIALTLVELRDTSK